MNSSETSFGDLSLNSSYEDYAEIETLTNSFDKITNQFDDDKSAKVRFNVIAAYEGSIVYELVNQ